MGDEGDFGESFRSEEPESTGETGSTEGAGGEDLEAPPGEGPKPGAEGAGEKGGSSWLIVAVILVVLVIAGVVAYFVFIKGGGEKTAVTDQPGPVATEEQGQKPTPEPEAIPCLMSKRPFLTHTFTEVADVSTLMKAQSETAGSSAVLELDLHLLMPTSTIAAGTKEHTFVASVFSFIEGNWTLFFTYDGCQEGNAQTFFSDSCYANFQEFRKNLREISKKTIPIGKQSCTPQLFAPPHRSHTAIKEVPVVGFTVKIQIDFQGQTFSVEVCEDQNWGSCTPFWTKEQVRFVESPKYGALDLIFHNGWNTPARVGNKFSIDQYTNVTEVCKLYRP